MGTLMLTILNRQYPVSDTVFLDACFLLDAHHGKDKRHLAARLLWRALQAEVAKSNAVAYCSASVVEECLFVLPKIHHEDVNGKDSWKALSKTERSAAFRKHRPAQEKFLNALTSQAWLCFVDCGGRHIQPAFREMKQRALWPADAFHVALARDCGARCLVTNDQMLSRALASDPNIDPFDYATIDMTPPT